MKRALLLVVLAAGAMLGAGAVLAQPMAAMKGTPLPSPDLDPGTVAVKVVAGAPQAGVSGVDVTLVVNGAPRVARTDGEGRAFFKELASGATVQAKIQDEDKKDVTSEEFQVPAQGGTRLMLSTRPLQAGMAGPMMGGGEGAAMPEPRKLSGQPRPEQSDAPGTYMVRLTYDDLKEAEPPVGINVALVGYGADEKVSVQIKPSGKDGRVQFTDLDRTGSTAYYALALLPRNGAADRLISQALTMVPQVGARVALSAEKRDSTAPQIDDTGDEGAPAGNVRVTLEGPPNMPGAELTVVDAKTGRVLTTAQAHPGPPDTKDIQGAAPFEPRPDLPKGTVAVEVQGGPGTTNAPLANVNVRLVPGDVPLESLPKDGPSADSDASGKMQVVGTAATMRAIVTINGRSIPTDTFDVSQTGGVLRVEAHWPSDGPPEGTLAVAGEPGQVVYAQARVNGQLYRSRPFQIEQGRGAHVAVAVLPRIMFSFEMSARIDDEFLAVQGKFTLFNTSWIPYAGNDGVLVPLPKGFKGAILADQDQTDVAVAAGEGFRVVRPLAPGARRFIGGFSLPVEHGTADWSLDLPFETWQSGIEIQQLPTMVVKTPSGATGRLETDNRGKWYVLSPIAIHAGHAMEMSISGLPSQPAWRVWVPRILGGMVVLLLLGGITIAIVLTRAGAGAGNAVAARKARRQHLLDELVALEQAGVQGQEARREAIVAELEKLWDAG